MFRRLLIVALFLCIISAKRTWDQLDHYSFEEYLNDFGKSYNNDDYAMRKAVFEEKLNKIRAHNAANKSWKEGVNHLTDQTYEVQN